MDKQVYSISQINEYIKMLFDSTSTLRDIFLSGEVSNCTGINKSGHLYFSLKDENSSIKAVMFKYDLVYCDYIPKNGDLIVVNGSISSYPPNGTYQIIVKSIKPSGEGDILLKKKLLIEKLNKEGLFSIEHKLNLPEYPLKVGVITGKNSAAFVDINENIKRRFPICEVIPFYSLVQGDKAVDDLFKALNDAENSDIDLLIISRGGGSVEDLSAFDNEKLARKIYDFKIPVISAVGHEINKSIIDYVADVYASTPTGAAELAVPDMNEIIDNLNQTKSYIDSLINYKIQRLENKLNILKGNKVLINLSNIYDNKIEKIKNYKTSINSIFSSYINQLEFNIKSYKSTINLLNPYTILDKGYSIIYNKDGKVVKDVNNININDDIKIKLNKGNLIANVKEKNNEK